MVVWLVPLPRHKFRPQLEAVLGRLWLFIYFLELFILSPNIWGLND